MCLNQGEKNHGAARRFYVAKPTKIWQALRFSFGPWGNGCLRLRLGHRHGVERFVQRGLGKDAFLQA